MVDFTAKHLEVTTNQFTVVPTTHIDSLSDTSSVLDTAVTSKELVNKVIDFLYSYDENSNSIESYVHQIDTSLLADSLRQIHQASSVDTSLNSDSVNFSVESISKLIDNLISDSSNYNQLNAISYIAVTSVFKDILDQALFETLLDTGQCSDILTTKFIHVLHELDSCLFNDTNYASRYIKVSISDTAILSEEVSNTAELFQYLKDTTLWYATLGLDGTYYLVYAMNTQTHAVSKYNNFAFNSMSENLAASSDGIYRLSGDDDNGTPISASIKTGVMDFGTSLQKQIPYAYLGITSNGDVILKTSTTLRGTKKEQWYEVKATNNAFENVRANFGKGVKSRYWQFELTNFKGSKFELESIEFLPLVLNRRVR